LKLSDLSLPELSRQLRQGFYFRTGAFVVNVKSAIPAVAGGLAMLYADYPVADREFADFHVTLAPPRHWRRYVRPQVFFRFEGTSPFSPLPLSQAFPMLEWGMNWCISSNAHSYLMIHAAVLEKNGRAVILAAPPGSGKSTLCAALMLRGWRLLSDELTLVRLADGQVEAVPRPVSLKNASIEVIRKFAPAAVFSPLVRDTVKGSVAHLKPSGESVQRGQESARAAWIIFPQYVKDSATLAVPVSPGRAMMRTADNSFNYGLLGQRGFAAMASLISHCNCIDFRYSELDEAVQYFDHLALASAA
jgi:HprK-related kinase A